ncbi:histone-lysine N-methyltransferase ash1 [Podospora aff. communis PSN243]|uniref:Histone-lysine N-methyltransferase ash1 n=1 Tax=Podospora aff. communis PSN243 TaxID=3040156 RepID=A0AAV9H5A2_9PEZI|nr:histone-lysine N-methyltransferase ash1 [Podospora aff. communis PSN243]
MAPIKPHWAQPSHPDIQEVIVNDAEFFTKSISKVTLPAWALFAKLDFPPCTQAAEPTYATVQYGRDKHLNLNSDLLYINHSCEPSLYFDMTAMAVTAGPNGVKAGEELTFFYPSTEWYMAQPFDCLCGKETCRGRISGARDMTSEQLGNAHLNVHIRQLLAENYAAELALATPAVATNGTSNGAENGTVQKNNYLTLNGAKAPGNGAAVEDKDDAAYLNQEVLEQITRELQEAIQRVEQAAAAACRVLKALQRQGVVDVNGTGKHTNGSSCGIGSGVDYAYLGVTDTLAGAVAGSLRRGPTSRELSGEMGGDTSVY